MIIFGCYILFTRQPDFFDGELYPATVQLVKNNKNQVATISYDIAGKQYQCALEDAWLYSANEKTQAIIEHEHPEKAKAYCFWGYWLNWREFIASIVIGILLFQVAVSITKNPTPAALLEQLSYKEEKKTKYDF